MQLMRTLLVVVLVCSSALLQASVLPEDRLDVLYHQYEGGGMKINGPSVLVLSLIHI